VRPVLAIVSLLALPGCAILFTEQHAVQPVDTAFLATDRARVDCGPVLSKEPPPTAAQPVYKREIRDAWGEPDEVVRTGAQERWIYAQDRIWSGVWGIIVVIPVPFVIPTDRKRMELEFAEDRLRSVNVHYQHATFGGCSLIPIPAPHGVFFGCQGEEARLDPEISSFCTFGRRLKPVGAVR
jgi:hypothetical protein